MAHPANSYNTHSDLLIWALALSLLLHSVLLGLLPGFSFKHSDNTNEPLTVELQQLPPPPPPPVLEPEKPKPPEPPTPEPKKPKLEKIPPKRLPPPALPPPAPAVTPTHSEVPPPQPMAEPPKVAPPPPAAIAVEQKPAASPPTFTAPAPQPAPAPTAHIAEPDDDGLGEVRDAYGRALRDELTRHTRYPAVAAMKGWEGKVKIRLQVDNDGNVIGTPEVTESSGHKMLDDEAVKTILKMSPLPLPPAPLQGKPIFINTTLDYHKPR